VKKVRLTTNTAEGNEGDIVDLDDTTADIYIREGMATTDFEEEKSVGKGTPTEEKTGIERGRRSDMVGKNRDEAEQAEHNRRAVATER